MKPYTVLLLRSDYVADTFGLDTYQAWVTTDRGVSAAISAAQQEAYESDNGDDCDDLTHYHVLAVYEGHRKDLKDLA